MRIYVAGKWEDRDRVKEVMNKLTELGHTITRDWTTHEGFSPEERVRYAMEDMAGVFDSDCLVALTIDKYNYKGLYCEVGATLIWWKPVYVVGDACDECIFWSHPMVKKFGSVDELLVYFTSEE